MEAPVVGDRPKPPTRHKKWFVLSALFLNLSIGFAGGWVATTVHNNGVVRPGQGNTPANQRIVTSESEVIADVAAQVSPSVVSITVDSAQSVGFGRTANSQSAGTGMIISTDGVILTNKHVIPDGAQKVAVVTSDGKSYTDVQIIGRDPLNDIAYIKVNKPENFKAVKLGDSDQLRVGDKVIAIGNALGEFSNSVTMGIISAKGRPIQAGEAGTGDSEQLQNLIQTDAAINQGNSGGPLLNINGEVVGMNTAIAGNAQNIGFSIPINDIKSGLKTVLEKGKVERPYLGVRYSTVTSGIAKQLNLPVSDGAYISGSNGDAAIVSDSPAAKAGLQEKDIITKVDDSKLDASHTLTSVLAQKSVGDTVKLTINRGGKEQTISVKLEAAPAQ